MCPRIPALVGALAVVAACVAGCEDAPTTTVVHQVEDPWSFAQATLMAGPMPVIIEGRAYDVDPGRIAGVVTRALAVGVTRTATARFAADPDRLITGGVRMVMTFNGGEGLDGFTQCAGRSAGGDPAAGGAVRAITSLCMGETLLVTVRGRLGRSDGLEDPRFAALIRQIAVDLFASPEGR